MKLALALLLGMAAGCGQVSKPAPASNQAWGQHEMWESSLQGYRWIVELDLPSFTWKEEYFTRESDREQVGGVVTYDGYTWRADCECEFLGAVRHWNGVHKTFADDKSAREWVEKAISRRISGEALGEKERPRNCRDFN